MKKQENHKDIYALFVIVVLMTAFSLGNVLYRVYQRDKCVNKWASMECASLMGTEK